MMNSDLKKCHQRLDLLRTYSAWLRGTSPIGVSNDSMGAMPNHPLYLQVINNLKRYARNWGFPYLTIMLSTGPLFLTIMWKEYVQTLQNSDVGVAVMPEEWYVLSLNFNMSHWTSGSVPMIQ